MNKYPIYYGDQVIGGGSTLESAQEIVQELIEDGYLEDELVIAMPEEPVVAEDDWELGPACGLDPEICESCQ